MYILLSVFKLSRIWRATGGFLLILLILLISVSAFGQKKVPKIIAEECETVEFSVVEWPGDRYTWDIYADSTNNFAINKGDLDPVLFFEKGMYEGSKVKVLNLQPGSYFLRIMVWDEVQCTNNLLVFNLVIIKHIPYAELYGDSVCYGEPVLLKIVFSGPGPWKAVYTYGDGSTHLNLNNDEWIYENVFEFTPAIPPLPVGATEFWILQVTDQCSVEDQIVDKEVVRIFPRPSSSRIYVSDMLGP